MGNRLLVKHCFTKWLFHLLIPSFSRRKCRKIYIYIDLDRGIEMFFVFQIIPALKNLNGYCIKLLEFNWTCNLSSSQLFQSKILITLINSYKTTLLHSLQRTLQDEWKANGLANTFLKWLQQLVPFKERVTTERILPSWEGKRSNTYIFCYQR